MDILVMAICSVISGGTGWEHIELFGKAKYGCKRSQAPQLCTIALARIAGPRKITLFWDREKQTYDRQQMLVWCGMPMPGLSWRGISGLVSRRLWIIRWVKAITVLAGLLA